MGGVLVPGKDLSKLSSAAYRQPSQEKTFTILDRLLAGAANEGLSVALLLLRIDQYARIQQTAPPDLVQGLITGFFSFLLDQTPGECYVDSIDPNEFLLVFPGLSTEQAVAAGETVRQRFASWSSPYAAELHTRLTLSGGISLFPTDTDNRLDLFRHACDGALKAMRKGGNQIRYEATRQYLPKTIHYSKNQLDVLKQIAEHHGVNDAALFREALDDLLFKYSSLYSL